MLNTSKLNLLSNEKLITAITFAWLLLTYHLILRNYFPFPNGYMGHDYSLFLPMLIDNYFWFAKNGFLTPPWFSPAFCGGQVNFADPQSIFYSLPQFLLFTGMELINAVYVSALIFASAGFYGMYLLSRRIFNFSLLASLLCAAIFMYNNFFIYRMIVGHITFQGFMLLPLISYCLLAKSTTTFNHAIKIIMAAMLMAYWFVSGMAIIIIPCILSIIAIALVCFIYKKIEFVFFLKNIAAAGLISLAVSASKLMGSVELMNVFPRTEYPLPGLDSFINIINVFAHSLWVGSIAAAELAHPLWKNTTLPMPPHEMAFGLTPIPLIIIMLGCILSIHYRFTRTITSYTPITLKNLYAIASLILILLIPFAIIYYSEPWNAFLKMLPIISSTASPQRWMLIYMFIIIIIMGINIDNFTKKIKRLIFISSLVILPIITWLDPKVDDVVDVYSSKKLSDEFNKAKEQSLDWTISANAIITPYLLGGRNYFAIRGYNVLNCYNPTYGFFFEKISFNSIESGDPLAEIKPNVLNIRNPACILYPKENNCKLWDNFSTQEKSKAAAFVNYKPFDFKRSRMQQVADWITQLSLIVIIVLLISWSSLHKHKR